MLTRAVADARVGLVRSGALDALALRLAAGLRDGLVARVEADPDAIAEPLARLIGDLAARLRADAAARARLDARHRRGGGRAWSATCGRRSAATSPG